MRILDPEWQSRHAGFAARCLHGGDAATEARDDLEAPAQRMTPSANQRVSLRHPLIDWKDARSLRMR